MPGSRRHWRLALLLLCLLASGTVQLAAATHWHRALPTATSDQVPRAPAGDGVDHDGCLLCQVAAHAGTMAAPPAPWVLASALESRAVFHLAADRDIVTPRPSHSWQGRAPPRV
jgi:hypothetical protein